MRRRGEHRESLTDGRELPPALRAAAEVSSDPEILDLVEVAQGVVRQPVAHLLTRHWATSSRIAVLLHRLSQPDQRRTDPGLRRPERDAFELRHLGARLAAEV